MPDLQPSELHIYRAPNGQEPFTQWFESISDLNTRAQIQTRIDRLGSGNLGNHKSLGDGIFELRLELGSGYRVYFAHADISIVLLLCGGDESSQDRDIKRAKAYWQECKEESK